MDSVHPIDEQINSYSSEIRKPNRVCSYDSCPHCSGRPDEFSIHEYRKRKFRYIVERLVRLVVGLLARWVCPLCGDSFTEYPPWVVPHKRFIRQAVLENSGRYLDEDGNSLRKASRRKPHKDAASLPICYDPETNPYKTTLREEDGREPVFAHSTIWHWSGFLGGLKDFALRTARRIRRTDSRSDLHRRIWRVPSWKYRSQARRRLLERGRRLLYLLAEHERLFGRTFFPYALQQSGGP